jgi:hypothetical protein
MAFVKDGSLSHIFSYRIGLFILVDCAGFSQSNTRGKWSDLVEQMWDRMASGYRDIHELEATALSIRALTFFSFFLLLSNVQGGQIDTYGVLYTHTHTSVHKNETHIADADHFRITNTHPSRGSYFATHACC